MYIRIHIYTHETDRGLGQMSMLYFVELLFDPSHYLFRKWPRIFQNKRVFLPPKKNKRRYRTKEGDEKTLPS